MTRRALAPRPFPRNRALPSHDSLPPAPCARSPPKTYLQPTAGKFEELHITSKDGKWHVESATFQRQPKRKVANDVVCVSVIEIKPHFPGQ